MRTRVLTVGISKYLILLLYCNTTADTADIADTDELLLVLQHSKALLPAIVEPCVYRG